MVAAPARRPRANVSPRQVADALGVSESSVKRWSDAGLIATAKTAGGHRKLVLADVLRFVREQGYDIGRPESLGLPGRLPRAADDTLSPAALIAALVAGDGETARRVVVGLFVRGVPLTDLFDHVVGPAIREVGVRWEHGSVRVFEEHRATVLVMRTLQDLRALLPRPTARARVAVVATLTGDPYTIAIGMTELTLAERGWAVTNLGPDTPAFTIVEALVALQPRVLALGVNSMTDSTGFVDAFEIVAEAARVQHTAVVVGGPALTTEVRRRIHYAVCCATMRELADFAGSL